MSFIKLFSLINLKSTAKNEHVLPTEQRERKKIERR